MRGLLIADKDLDCRKQMAELFIEAGYNVIVTNSAANALDGILKNTAQVVLLGSEFDELTAADLIPLLKQCNRKPDHHSGVRGHVAPSDPQTAQ